MLLRRPTKPCRYCRTLGLSIVLASAYRLKPPPSDTVLFLASGKTKLSATAFIFVHQTYFSLVLFLLLPVSESFLSFLSSIFIFLIDLTLRFFLTSLISFNFCFFNSVPVYVSPTIYPSPLPPPPKLYPNFDFYTLHFFFPLMNTI